MKVQSRQGSILIMALWVLGMLSIFAVQIGFIIGQRIKLVSRLEQRSQLRYMTESGVKKAIAALQKDLQQSNHAYTPYGKYYRHNNEDIFKDQKVGEGGLYSVSYPGHGQSSNYGVSDEERRLNINYATRAELSRLVESVVTKNESQLTKIVDGIIGWREFGDSNVSGFYSDDYYQMLAKSYSAKNAEFELFDELLLVQGITPEVYAKLLPFITVYGDGMININTASFQVLYALGLTSDLVQKILTVRRGFDEREATVDDYLFMRTYDIATEVNAFIELTQNEIQQIDILNQLDKIKVNSAFFRIAVKGALTNRSDTAEAICVYNSRDNWVEYYREK